MKNSAIYFITGNKAKFIEVQALLPEIKQLDIDLPEIQELDSEKIISAKLDAAFLYSQDSFIVEDNSLILKGMNGLPGPLIKWFLKSIGNEGLVALSKLFGSDAQAKVVIGYAKNKEHVQFFEGSIDGTIVEARGDKGFGWDPIFLPKGQSRTFGEMDLVEKNSFSMRKIAVEKLKSYLSSH